MRLGNEKVDEVSKRHCRFRFNSISFYDYIQNYREAFI